MKWKLMSAGLLMVLLAVIIGFSVESDDIKEVKGSEHIWSKSSPVQDDSLSTGIVDSFSIVETVQENVDSGYKKTSDGKVFWENSRGYIEVDPHTCTSFHCEHNIIIKNKDLVDHSLNFAFRFPDNAKNPRFYRLETLTKTRPLYTEETYTQEVYNNQTESYETIQRTRTVESGTETYEVQEYVDRSGAFRISEIDGKNVYYTTSVQFLSGKTQQGRFEYDLTPKRTQSGYETSGKWEMYVWKGEYSDPTWSLTLDPWFNTSFGRRFNVTVLPAQVDETINDFPVFFNVSDAPSEFWSNVQSDGSDIVVTQGEDVQVPRELVYFNTTDMTGELRFRGNISSSANTTFYIYYDNPSATEVNDPTTYNSSWLAVYHMRDNTTSTVNDSTSNNNQGNKFAANEPLQVQTGQIYQAQNFDGTDDFINIGSGASVDNIWDGGGTLLAWVLTESDGESNNGEVAGGGANVWTIPTTDELSGQTKIGFSHEFDSGGGFLAWTSDDRVIPIGSQTLLSVVYSSDSSANNPVIYVNASSVAITEAGTGTGTRISDAASDKAIGSRGFGTLSFDGNIDEFRLYDGTMSSTFISTIYNNEFSPSTFYAVGDEETDFGWTISLDAPTDGFINTTVDGNTTFFATPLNVQNSTASIVNSTLYSNVSGTWESRASNATELTNNTQFSITDIEYPDGNYIWNMELCGDDGGVQCVFDTANFTYIVRTTPEYSSNSTTPSSGVIWGPDVENVTFNVTWFDDGDNFDTALIEHNLTGTLSNFTMTNLTGAGETANYSYTFSTRPAAGTYVYRLMGNDTSGNVNSTESLTYTVAQRDADITITSSAGISFTTGTATTITATADSEAIGLTLELDSTVVSNPTTVTLAEGTHNATAYISDTENFSSASETVIITVNPLRLCTTVNTFAFEQNFTATGANMTFNFTDEVSVNQVKSDLSDVFVTQAENDTSLITINQTDGNYLNVNTTGMSTVTVRWANYFANRSYENGSINASSVSNLTNPTQINQYLTVNFLDEITFEPLYPPSSETNLFINCDLGESVIPVDNQTTQLIVATENVTDRALVRVSYDASNFYSRQLLPEAADAITLNFYLVDAFEFAVDRIDFVMADPNFYDGKLVVYITVSGQTIVITEGNFDVSRLFAAYLREDALYSIRVVTDSTTREFGEILVVEPATKTLGELTVPLVPETKVISGEVLMQSFMNDNRTNLTTQYVDSLENTTSVTITVFFENGTVFQNNTYAADSVSASFNTTGLEDENFFVTFLVDHATFGTINHLVNLFASGVAFLPAVGTTLLAFLSVAAMLLIGGNATKETIGGSSIAMSLIMLAVMAVGWFPRNTALIVFTILLLIFGISVSFKRTNEE